MFGIHEVHIRDDGPGRMPKMREECDYSYVFFNQVVRSAHRKMQYRGKPLNTRPTRAWYTSLYRAQEISLLNFKELVFYDYGLLFTSSLACELSRNHANFLSVLY